MRRNCALIQDHLDLLGNHRTRYHYSDPLSLFVGWTFYLLCFLPHLYHLLFHQLSVLFPSCFTYVFNLFHSIHLFLCFSVPVIPWRLQPSWHPINWYKWSRANHQMSKRTSSTRQSKRAQHVVKKKKDRVCKNIQCGGIHMQLQTSTHAHQRAQNPWRTEKIDCICIVEEMTFRYIPVDSCR